jgi:hypothetical protein
LNGGSGLGCFVILYILQSEALKDRAFLENCEEIQDKILGEFLAELFEEELEKYRKVEYVYDDLIGFEIGTCLAIALVEHNEVLEAHEYVLENLIDEIINEDFRETLESEYVVCFSKMLKIFAESISTHKTCCIAAKPGSLVQKMSCAEFRQDVIRRERHFIGRWVALQSNFPALSLDGKLKLSCYGLLDSDDFAKLTREKMVDIDFCQEDYELIYQWPLLAKKEIFQKQKKIKSEKAKSSKVHKSAAQSKKITKIKPPAKVNYEQIQPPKNSSVGDDFQREQSYYDEEIEDFFSFRDSQNRKVDDIIDLLSSDEDKKGIYLHTKKIGGIVRTFFAKNFRTTRHFWIIWSIFLVAIKSSTRKM